MRHFSRIWLILILFCCIAGNVRGGSAVFQTVIKTVPSGVEIIITGREERIISPARVETDTRQLELTIRHPGYQEYQALYTLGAGTNEIFIRLSRLSSRFSFLRQFKTGHQPKDVIFSPDGRYLIISLLDDRGLQVYDMETGVLRMIDLTKYSKTPFIVEGKFSPDGREFWCNQMSTRGITYVLSMPELTVKKVLSTNGNWSKVGEFSPDGRTYYVSNWLSNDISIFNVQTYAYTGRVKTTGKAPRGMGFSADGRFLYAVFFDSGEIMKFDISAGYKLVDRIKTGGANGRFCPNYRLGLAYIGNMAQDRIYLYDFLTGKVAGFIQAWEKPNNIRLSPDGRYMFVSNRGPNNPRSYLLRSPVDGRVQVFAIDQDYRLLEELLVGNQPTGLAVSPDGGILAQSNFLDDTVELYRINL